MEEYESLPESCGVQIHMLAGAGAGIAEHCVMYPVDVVKTRMQSLTPCPQATYRSVPDALLHIVSKEGFLRPWKGMSVLVCSAGPAHAMYFACYEKMKRVFATDGNGNHSPLAQGLAGCLATVLHDAVMNPADVVKQRLQVYNSPYKSIRGCVRDVYKREGMRAFYRSYTTQLTMNVPFQSIHFMTYELMQEKTNKERRYNPTAHMVSGGVAGGVASAATNPLDVCKTLLNTQEVAVVKRSRIEGMIQATRTIYQCCGWRGYCQGLSARIAYSVPSTALAWSVYEFVKYLLYSGDCSDNPGTTGGTTTSVGGGTSVSGTSVGGGAVGGTLSTSRSLLANCDSSSLSGFSSSLPSSSSSSLSSSPSLSLSSSPDLNCPPTHLVTSLTQ